MAPNQINPHREAGFRAGFGYELVKMAISWSYVLINWSKIVISWFKMVTSWSKMVIRWSMA